MRYFSTLSIEMYVNVNTLTRRVIMDNILYTLIPVAFALCLFGCIILLITGKRKFDLEVKGLGIMVKLTSKELLEKEDNGLDNS